jgi:hypothetical protein
MNNIKEIDLQQMSPLRDVSQKIAQMLNRRLGGYLATLTPLFAPRKVLGEFMQSAFNERVPGADKNFAEIEEKFKALARETFGIPSKLGTPLPNIKNELEVHPWEYLHQLDGDAAQTVRISSPVRWVVSYAGGYTLNELLAQRARGEKADAADLRQLVLQSLAIWKLIDLSPDIAGLLTDLRFKVSVETSTVSGELPVVVVTADVPSFRPQDDVIRTVTQLSGKQVFEELVDVDGIAGMVDPFVAELNQLKG